MSRRIPYEEPIAVVKVFYLSTKQAVVCSEAGEKD